MIRSMTGFGNATMQFGSKTISVDLRSVNSKFFDFNVKLPSTYRDKESELRLSMSRELERGKIDLMIAVESEEPMRKARIDKKLFAEYFKELQTLSRSLSISASDSDYVSSILRIPDVLSTDGGEADPQEWEQMLTVIRQAVVAFQSFREQEGRMLERDLMQRVRSIEELLGKIEIFEPQRIESIRQRLNTSLEEFVEANNIDRNRLEQEMIFYIEKLDISEEKIRLRSHCEYFNQVLNETGSTGKKLNFISQEIGREINTIGSKSNHAGMQKLVVEMKDELEKIKEQLMNVL